MNLKVALLLVALAVLIAALMPRQMVATRTVGDQTRAVRQLRVESPAQSDEPRTCAEGEIPIDRDPCVRGGANYAPAQ
ncbi:MAG: hypothetical protein HYV09_26335 [Deltaproteobacteria bacterium]|nr:hypothetical protein [Deltaproteobacteria bacterium]